jgi:uncharacterized protein (DUF2141 family)
VNRTLGCLLAAALVVVAPSVRGADGATLVVRVEGIGKGEGEVRAIVCATGFDDRGCALGASRKPSGASEDLVFENIPPGNYGIAVYFDTNGNGELDTVMGGVPTEPYAFSNDVGRLAPPDFQKALVKVGPGRTVVTVWLRRLFGSVSPGGHAAHETRRGPQHLAEAS